VFKIDGETMGKGSTDSILVGNGGTKFKVDAQDHTGILWERQKFMGA